MLPGCVEVELGHGGCVPPRTFLVMVGCKRVRRHQSGGWMAFRAIKIPRLCKFRAVETLRKINRGWSCVSFSFSLFISLSLFLSGPLFLSSFVIACVYIYYSTQFCIFVCAYRTFTNCSRSMVVWKISSCFIVKYENVGLSCYLVKS